MVRPSLSLRCFMRARDDRPRVALACSRRAALARRCAAATRSCAASRAAAPAASRSAHTSRACPYGAATTSTCASRTRTVPAVSSSSSARSCDTTTPTPRWRRRAAISSARPSASRWLVGSSHSSTSGADSSAAPTCQRLRSPGDSVAQRARSSGVSRRRARSRMASPSPAVASSAASSGGRSTDCSHRATRARSGSTVTDPDAGASRPATRRNSVVLPAPLSPTRPHQPGPT